MDNSQKYTHTKAKETVVKKSSAKKSNKTFYKKTCVCINALMLIASELFTQIKKLISILHLMILCLKKLTRRSDGCNLLNALMAGIMWKFLEMFRR